MKKILLLLIITINFYSLKSQNDTLKYIFIGHSYQTGVDGEKVDSRIEQLDLKQFDGIWLGGDLCVSTTRLYSTMQYADSIYNLSSPSTLWTLGNHDLRYEHINWIEKFTKRKTYYTYTTNNITFIVTNTNLSVNDCFELNRQDELIKNVCDTITNSKFLIVLQHHCTWNGVPGLPQAGLYANLNCQSWKSNCYDTTSTFVNSIYPSLVKVKNKGINVICIMGDIGSYSKQIEFTSDDGIKFIGAGFYHEQSPEDKVILFKHIPSQDKLEWSFKSIDSLIEN